MSKVLGELRERAVELSAGDDRLAEAIVRRALMRRAAPHGVPALLTATDIAAARILATHMKRAGCFDVESPDDLRREVFANAAGHSDRHAFRLAELLDEFEL